MINLRVPLITSYACSNVPSGMRPPAGTPSPPDPTGHHGRLVPSRATATFTKQRYLRKKLQHTSKAVGSSGSVSSLDSISEDEELEWNDELDKDLAYAFHVNPMDPMGDEAVLQALFAEDPEEEGIQDNFEILGENGPAEGVNRRRNGAGDGTSK